MSKILILSNHYNTLRIFRRELLEAMCRMGHEVVVSIPPCDTPNIHQLESYGCRVVLTPGMNRRGYNPAQDLLLLRRYISLMRQEKPDKVVAYTIKPNIYGGMACKYLQIPFYANITGLGSAFQTGKCLMRLLVSSLYRFSLNRAKIVFFENKGNLATLADSGIIRHEQAVLMPGAGVNLALFTASPYPDDNDDIRFLFVGRIMKEKGIEELFSAIRMIHPKYPQASFDFIGWYEDAYQAQVEQLQNEGLIRFHGFQSEVRPYIERCHCIVLPSWHEGMSNTLLEGAAMARPLITSNIYGCKEAVDDGVSGFLTIKQDVQSLSQQLERFILLPWEKKKNMGLVGRCLMESKFDKKDVVSSTIKYLEGIVSSQNSSKEKK